LSALQNKLAAPAVPVAINHHGAALILEFLPSRTTTSEGVFRPCLVLKNFQDFPSHRMFGHMHRTLNVDEKKLITQFGRKPRDESFEFN
jgi:hypothetical protein